MYATSSIDWSTTRAISLTNCSTMGDPATGNMGFGIVILCGLSLDPLPAIGTNIFNLLYIKF